MNLIIIGPQGSGKGTQAKLIAEKYQLNHISTGELLRKEISEKTALGQEISACTARGELVPEDIFFSILEKADFSQPNGFILDGSPRNMSQQQTLEKIFSRTDLIIDAVIFIDIPYKVSIERMKKRALIEGRTDDNEQAIKNRLSIYQNETLPVVEHYRSQGKVIDIDGTPGIEAIFQNICTQLESVK